MTQIKEGRKRWIRMTRKKRMRSNSDGLRRRKGRSHSGFKFKEKKEGLPPLLFLLFFNLNSIVSIFQNFNACIPIGNEAHKL
jgi:hypothetical protein